MTIQVTTKITFIVSAEQDVLDRREQQSLSSRAIVLVRQENSSMSFVKQINTSIPSSLRWFDIAVEEAVTRDMGTVVVVVVEVFDSFQNVLIFLGSFRGGRTGANNVPVGNRSW